MQPQSQPNATSQLPLRFREEAFRKYEAVITSAVKAYPIAFTIDCNLYGLAAVTFACRFRDAMRSLAENRWSTNVDLSKFDTCWQQIVVSEKASGKQVTIGSREEIRRLSNSQYVTSSPNLPTFITNQPVSTNITLTTIDQKHLLINLTSLRLLASPIRCTGFTETECREFEQTYDCAIERNVDGTVTII